MKLKLVVLLGLLIVVSVGKGFTDYRYYAWTYQFMTMMPGHSEIEFYTELSQPNAGDESVTSWKRQIEIETGITKK